MWFKHIPAKWYYIDPTQQYNDSIDWNPADHDGSSIDKADRELPAKLVDGTVYLIRRSNHQHVVDEGATYPRIWCYNNSAGCELPSGSMRIAIVGMPKQDDPVFKYMPEDAKTQWGPDVSEYATLAQNFNRYLPDTHFIRLNARDVVIYNLRIRTLSMNPGYGDRYNGKGFIMANCENFEASKIYSCMIHGDILDPSDVTGPWFTSANNDGGYGCPSLFHVTYTNTCHIYDSTMISKPDCRDSGHYIYLYSRFGNCTIENITVHSIPLANNYDNPDRFNHNGFFHFTTDGWYRSLSKISVHDIKTYFYRAKVDGYHGYHRRLLTGQANLWDVHDITIEEATDDKQLPDATINKIPINYLIELSAFNAGCIIKDIMCNLPKCKGLNLLRYRIEYRDGEYSNFFTPKSQWHILKNISFIGVGQGDDTTDSWGSTNICVLWVDNAQCRENDRVYNGLNPTCDQLIVQNINIKAYYDTKPDAIDITGAMLDMVNNHIQGKVTIRKCTGKIGSITTYDAGGALTDKSGANLVYIGSIACNRNNPSNPYTGQQAIDPSWRSQILVGETNTKFIQDNNFADLSANDGDNYYNRNDHMYLCTSDTLEGNFVARNRPAKAETWSVYRTGGHSCTLRFVCEVADIVNYPLRIGDLPFAGIKRHLQKGINKCTFYMTMFGYNDYTQIKDKMRFRAKLPSGLYVGSNGEWSEDTETVWNNIELNTSCKYTFYIDMEEEGDVEFSYQFWWYMLGGYTYLDPFPAIELVE
nr:MAG TPA: hypothetical protein [Bacteriophage sp.]